MKGICHIPEMDNDDLKFLVNELEKKYPDRVRWMGNDKVTDIPPNPLFNDHFGLSFYKERRLHSGDIFKMGRSFPPGPIEGWVNLSTPADLWEILDKELGKQTAAQLPTIDPSHYPHKCPHCGAPSYNSPVLGKVDCSANCQQ